MRKPRIGVKYCGNCNPLINGPEVVKEIAQRVPEVNLVSPDLPDCAACLVVSGCRRDCASRSGLSETVVVIAGNSVDNEEYQLKELAAEAARRIKMLLGQS